MPLRRSWAGTCLFGDVGATGGTRVGASIIGVLSNGLHLMGIPSFYLAGHQGCHFHPGGVAGSVHQAVQIVR